MNKASCCIVALLAIATSDASAADATVSYRATVVDVYGAQADQLPIVGERINISYTIDPTVADFRPDDATSGVYFNAVKNLAVALPGMGFEAIAASGTTQTYNLPDQDDWQVYCYNGGIVNGASIGGLPVLRTNLFFGQAESPPDPTTQPGMLTSDAQPLVPVVGATFKTVLLTTDAGSTGISFEINAAPTVGELVVDGNATIAALVGSGAIKSGVGGALNSKLSDILAAHTADNTAQACLAWKGFYDQVRNLPPKQISADGRVELLALAAALREELGGC